MREVAQELGIDTEFVARDLDFHRGVGRAYLSQFEKSVASGRWEAAAFAATSFRRAGAHALLLDEAKLAAIPGPDPIHTLVSYLRKSD